jgi:predicted dienelactone hydrolase
VKVAVAVDPALVNAMTDDSLAALDLPVLIVNLGAADEAPAAMRADGRAALIPGAEYQAVDGAAHFSFLARCSAFRVFMIGVAGDDNICADRGVRSRAEVQDELALRIGDFMARGLALR